MEEKLSRTIFELVTGCDVNNETVLFHLKFGKLGRLKSLQGGYPKQTDKRESIAALHYLAGTCTK